MKYLLIFFLLVLKLFALDIYINSAKKDNLPYAILHIIDKDPVECKVISEALDKKNYICQIDKTYNKKISEKKLKLLKLDFFQKKDKFFIRIIPKYGSKLIPSSYSLYNAKDVIEEKSTSKSKHWVILLFQKPLYEKDKDAEGINFPIAYDEYLRPNIGPVDLNGAPVRYAKSQDINNYLEIQKEFKNAEYGNLAKDVDRTIKMYPHTIFKSDLLLYKLKAMDISIQDNITPLSEKYTNNDVANLAKQWMRDFSSNKNITQVLLVLVRNYLRVGSSADVNYFLEILINEHKDSPDTKRAILYYADSLYNKNNKNKAMKLYEDVLYSAKNLDIASLAAIKLANSKMDSGSISEAKKYLSKVLNANENYLLKDREGSSKLAVKLAKNGLQGIAATIDDLLLKNLEKDELDKKESLLKQAGDWYAQSGNVNKAYERYMQYKKEFKDGIYIDEVNKAIDRLFFKIKDNNETKLLKYYDVLIGKYNNDIKDKAIIEKAKLLLKQKRYKDVVSMKDLITEAEDKNSSTGKNILENAAKILISKNIKEKNCQSSIKLIEDFSVPFKTLSDSKNLFRCFMETLRFKKAEELALSKSNTKSLSKKFIWLENLAEAYCKLQKYDDILRLKDDIFSLSKIIKKPVKASVYRILVKTYLYKKEFNKTLNLLDKLDKNWPNSIENIEIYYKIAIYANDTRKDTLLIKYAKKILSLQKRYKLDTYTPKIDFLYMDALKRVKKIKSAKNIAENLLNKRLNEENRARVEYELGELSLKLNDAKEAKKYFQECTKIKSDNSWKNLCIDNLKLLSN